MMSQQQQQQQQMKHSGVFLNKERLKPVVSSGAGAIITALLMTPLDVVKIRLQAQNRLMHKGDCFVYRNGLMDHLCTCFNGADSWYNRRIPGGRYHGSLDALVKIARAEGLGSLWSGLPPTLVMAVPQVILYFTVYEETKRFMGYHEIHNPNPLLPVMSGGMARTIAVTAVSPLELIRTKIQSEKIKYSEIFSAVRYSVKSQGLRSLYKGWVSTVWRDVPFSMVYWYGYETLKTKVLMHRNTKSLNSFATFLCGATAGSFAAAITCPLDVVKTFRQVQLGEKELNKHARKTTNLIREVYQTKGFQGLFAGNIFSKFNFSIKVDCHIIFFFWFH